MQGVSAGPRLTCLLTANITSQLPLYMCRALSRSPSPRRPASRALGETFSFCMPSDVLGEPKRDQSPERLFTKSSADDELKVLILQSILLCHELGSAGQGSSKVQLSSMIVCQQDDSAGWDGGCILFIGSDLQACAGRCGQSEGSWPICRH